MVDDMHYLYKLAIASLELELKHCINRNDQPKVARYTYKSGRWPTSSHYVPISEDI